MLLQSIIMIVCIVVARALLPTWWAAITAFVLILVSIFFGFSYLTAGNYENAALFTGAIAFVALALTGMGVLCQKVFS